MLLLEYDVPAGQHLPSGQYTIFGRNFNVSIDNCCLFLLVYKFRTRGVLTIGFVWCRSSSSYQVNRWYLFLFICLHLLLLCLAIQWPLLCCRHHGRKKICLLGGHIDLAFRIGSYITPVVKNLPLLAICSLRVAQRKFVYTLLCLSRSMWSTVCSGVGFLPWKAQHTRTWAYGDLRLRLTFRYPATFLRVNIFPVGALIRP